MLYQYQSSNKDAERRQSPRWEPLGMATVVWTSGKHHGMGYLQDVSDGGCRVSGMTPPHSEFEVEIYFKTFAMRRSATLRRVRDDGLNEWAAAFEKAEPVTAICDCCDEEFPASPGPELERLALCRSCDVNS